MFLSLVLQDENQTTDENHTTHLLIEQNEHFILWIPGKYEIGKSWCVYVATYVCVYTYIYMYIQLCVEMCTKLYSFPIYVAKLKFEILNRHALTELKTKANSHEDMSWCSLKFPVLLVRIVRNYYGAHTAGTGCLALTGGKRNPLNTSLGVYNSNIQYCKLQIALMAFLCCIYIYIYHVYVGNYASVVVVWRFLCWEFTQIVHVCVTEIQKCPTPIEFMVTIDFKHVSAFNWAFNQQLPSFPSNNLELSSANHPWVYLLKYLSRTCWVLTRSQVVVVASMSPSKWVHWSNSGTSLWFWWLTFLQCSHLALQM